MKKLIFLCLSIASLASHADNLSITLSAFPSAPKVFTAPLLYSNGAGESMTATPPWTRIEFSLENNSLKPVRILKVHVHAVAVEGPTSDIDFTPDQFNFTLTCKTGAQVAFAFTNFGEFMPGGDGYLATVDHLHALPANCTTRPMIMVMPPTDFYVDKLPKSRSHKYKLSVTVTAIDMAEQTPITITETVNAQ